MDRKYVRVLLLAVFGIAGLFLINAGRTMSGKLEFLWVNESIHAAIEAFGVFIALLMAFLMFHRKADQQRGKYALIGFGFLSMGVLDGFHTISSPGNAFVFLHSIASLSGGGFFALTWFSKKLGGISKQSGIFWVVLLASVFVGAWSLGYSDSIPVMVQAGQFTKLAERINLIAGACFLISSLFFAVQFYRTGAKEDILFVLLTLFFGMAEITFKYSTIWDSGWWLWHGLRLLAYAGVLVVVFGEYQHMLLDIQMSFSQMKKSEEKLNQSKAYAERLFKVVPNGIVAVDLNRRIKAWNKKAEDITGYSSQEVIGQECVFIRGYSCENECSLCSEDVPKPIIAKERVITTKEGKEKIIRKNADLLTDEKGKIIGGIESFEDISEMKNAEENLKKQNKELERINKVMVGRELRMIELKKEIESLNKKLKE